MPERPERRMSEMADEADDAVRRYEDYKEQVDEPKGSNTDRLRALKRTADRAKLALHRGRTDG